MRATLEKRHGDDVGADDLRRQLHVLRKDVRELSQLVRGAARGKAESARDAMEEELEDGKRRLVELEDRARDQVRLRPLGSVLAAVGLGAVVGLFLGRR